MLVQNIYFAKKRKKKYKISQLIAIGFNSVYLISCFIGTEVSFLICYSNFL